MSLVMIGLVLAIFQRTGPSSTDESVSYFREMAAKYAECIPAGECGIATVFEDVFNSEGGGIFSGPGDDTLVDVDDSIIVDNDLEYEVEEPADGNTEITSETSGYRGPARGEPYVNSSGRITKDTAFDKLEELQTVTDKEDDKKDVGYSRKEWKHWTGTEGRSCWNTREYILNRDAVPGTVVYMDKSRQPTTNEEEACAIGTPIEVDGKNRIDSTNSGEWICPYNGQKITEASAIDIDHVIPLSNAARNGGQAWSAEKKEEFANDPENLLATSAKENRTKGDKGPGKYMPPLRAYRCQYAKTYTHLSHKYDLTITDSDYKVLKDTIESCKY